MHIWYLFPTSFLASVSSRDVYPLSAELQTPRCGSLTHCAAGILKKRFRILKTDIEFHTLIDVENVFLTCCALHNELIGMSLRPVFSTILSATICDDIIVVCR